MYWKAEVLCQISQGGKRASHVIMAEKERPKRLNTHLPSMHTVSKTPSVSTVRFDASAMLALFSGEPQEACQRLTFQWQRAPKLILAKQFELHPALLPCQEATHQAYMWVPQNNNNKKITSIWLNLHSDLSKMNEKLAKVYNISIPKDQTKGNSLAKRLPFQNGGPDWIVMQASC